MQSDLPNRPEWLRRVTVLGVGLLGGSVGLSLRRHGVSVVGYSRRPESCRAALTAGAVDEAFTDVESACHESDVVVVASPVDIIAPLTAKAAQVVGPNTLITDVGSTKARIVREVGQAADDALLRFVAAHPIAGSEKTGVANAKADLFDGKTVVLTPTAGTPSTLLDRAIAFWRCVGGEIVSMSPKEHDDRLAAVSHVPHLVSSLLARMLDEQSAPLVGSGWRDMTRVAAGDPAMWTAICMHNRGAILDQLDRLIGEMDGLRNHLQGEDPDAIRLWLEQAKSIKDGTRNQGGGTLD